MNDSTLWDQALEQLRREMTAATFDAHLRQSRMVEQSNSHLMISVRSDGARDWLEHRLREKIARVVANVAGEALEVRFVVVHSPESDRIVSGTAVEAPASSFLPQALPQPLPEGGEQRGEFPEGGELEEDEIEVPSSIVDFDYFMKGGGGWAKMAHYIPTFYRAYVGDEAIDVWEWVRAQSKDASAPWTPPVDVRPVELARSIGCSKQRLTGVWRPCRVFDRALFEEGLVLPECCGQHEGAQFGVMARPSKPYPDGRVMCRYWWYGALEILQAEGLAVWRKHGQGPNGTFITIQVYQKKQRLPLLTVRQVERLPGKLQMKHAQFLRERGKFEIWHKSTRRLYSLLALPVDCTGLALELPEKGVLSARALKNNVLSARALKNSRNHIFFANFISANEERGTD